MKRLNFLALVFVFILGLSIFLSACGSSSSSGTQQGAANLSVTDAPGDFDHVYITVKDVWFHTSEIADPRAADWLRYPLPAPVTVDLLSLSNGNMQSLWNNIQLPVGTYKQIRLFLEPTYPTATNPAPAGHLYWNEVVTDPTTTLPLYVPDPEHGIKLTGTFAVTGGSTLKLAIDFNAGEDIVEFHEGIDYVLKPRLNYYDLDHAGAIIGTLSTGGSGSFTNAGFVIKAERLATAEEMLDSGSTNTYHVVRRWTVPMSDGSGRFILYPISTLVTTTWDVVIRGLNTKTMIIKGVPITEGTTPLHGAADLGTISTSPSTTDYQVAGTIQSPTGAWVQFYQTLPGTGEYPYEIRFKHFNPLWGGFTQNFMLNDDQVQVANFITSGATLSFTTADPAGGPGHYDAVAGAILYQRSDPPTPVSSSTTTVAFNSPLDVISPYSSNSVSGTIVMGNPVEMDGQMNSGLLFAVDGGLIANTLNSLNSNINSQMAIGGTYTISLPGGFPGAFYGIDAVGWAAPLPSIYKAVAIPQIVDLSTGNQTADMQMQPLW